MKGISLIEQHVEKFVVALLAIVLVAVLAMQFLTSPNRVAMDRDDVNPGEIPGVLKERAERINLRLKGSDEESALVEGGIPKVADDFLAGLDRAVAPRTRLPQIDHSLAKSLLPGDVSSGDATYHVPRFAPLAMIEVRQESATIKPAVVASTPGLSELLPTAGENDLTWSIPVAKVDLKALRSELRAGPGDSVPIPELWYNGNLYLVDLVFERQELGADGWSEPAVVPPLPGAFSLRKELGKADAVLRDEVFRLLASRERALAILQPDFVETEREVFTPGSILGDAGGEVSGESDEVRRLRARLAQKTANLTRIEADLKELGGPLRGPDDKDRKKDGRDGDDGSSGGGGGTKTPGGGMGFGSGTAGGKRGTSGSGAEDEATRAKRRLLTGQFDRLSAEVERLTRQLKDLAPDAAAVTATGRGTELSQADFLLVWGHDLAVRPGATYRYRSRVEIFNPFFARKRQLSAKQADLADAFTLRTAVSEWSQPVTIEPEVTFFLVDAGPGEGRLGLGSAKFEVFRYEDGERRRETFVVQPGERIGNRREAGQDKREVDFGTDWFVVDVVEGLPGEGRDDPKGRNARVLVADGQGRTIFRTAFSDLENSLRRKFNDDVEIARLDALTPDQPATDTSGSSAPPMTPDGGPSPPGAN